MKYIILLLISINSLAQTDSTKKIPCTIIGNGASKYITNQQGVIIMRDNGFKKEYKDFDIDIDLYKHWFLNSKEGRIAASWLEFYMKSEYIGKDKTTPRERSMYIRNYLVKYVIPEMMKEIEKYGGY